MHKWWQNVLFFLMCCSLKFICYLHYQCHIIYYNHFLNLTIKANITVSYTPLFVGPSGDSSICSSLSAMEWVMEFCWAVEGGMRMKGHGLRVLKTKLSGYMGALVFHSRALLSPLLLSLSLSFPPLPRSLCVIAEGSEQLRSVLVVSEGIVCRLCLLVWAVKEARFGRNSLHTLYGYSWCNEPTDLFCQCQQDFRFDSNNVQVKVYRCCF